MPQEPSSIFRGAMKRLTSLLASSKKETSKTYYSNITIKHALMIVALLFSIVLFYYRFLANFDYREIVVAKTFLKVVCLFVPMGACIILTVIINKESFIKVAKFASPIIIFLGIVLMEHTRKLNILQFISITILGIGYGTIFGLIINLFLFSFSNTERLFTVLVFLFTLFTYSLLNNLLTFVIKNDDILRIIKDFVIPFIVTSLVFVTFLINNDIFVLERKPEVLPKYPIVFLLILTLLICICNSFVSVVQVNTHITKISMDKSFYSYTFYIGFVFSMIFSYIIFKYFKNALVILVVFYFVGLLLGYQLQVFNVLYNPDFYYNNSFFRRTSDIAFGFSVSLSYVIILMTVGKVLDDKGNKLTLVTIILSIFCFFISAYFLSKAFINIDIKIISTVFVLVQFLICFFLITVNVLNLLYKKDEKASQYVPNAIDPKKVLSQKEYAVLELLLEGLTLRQISAELAMKYDTVNFHYKNIYRKLEVNSKIELILNYGKDRK